MKIRTYTLDVDSPEEAANGQPHIAQLDLGRNIFMTFFGKSAEEAFTRADDWFTAETIRQKKLEGKLTDNVAAIANNVAKAIVGAMPDEELVEATGPGSVGNRGLHFAGKVWMFNSANNRVRVAASEVDSYLAQGYIKGGPRSVWKGK